MEGVEPREDCWSSEFWLEHCEGFRVDGPAGPVGYVEEVVRGSDGRALLLHVGGAAGRRVAVPVGEIVVVQPHRERVAVERWPWPEAEELGAHLAAAAAAQARSGSAKR